MNEQDPVSANEYVLRRIPRNDFDSTLPIPVRRWAFQPRKDDTDGLSVYRERIIRADRVAAGGRSPGTYYVARLAVSSLHALNLSVQPKPTPGDLPGHAIIPELSRAAYEADKRRSKALQEELARLASQAIVHRPTS